MSNSQMPNSEEVVRLVLEAGPDAIVAADKTGRIVLVNETAEKLFGYGRAAFLALKVEDLVPERLRNAHANHRKNYQTDPIRKLMGQGRDLYAIRQDGTEFPVEIGITPVETPKGRWVVSSIVDITKRKQAEDKLNAYAEELLRSNAALQKQAEILENIHDAVFLLNDEGIIQSWNRGAETIYGYSANQAIGQRASMLLPSEDHKRFDKILAALSEEGHTEESFWCQQKSGDRIYVAVRATISRDKNGAVICANDISEQKHLEEQVLQASEKEQRRIGQDIHDDLCQQLASIGCLTKVLEQRLRQVYDEGAEHLAQIGDMVSQANVRAREIARGLVPSVLEADGLMGALEDLAARTDQIYSPVSCKFECPDPIVLDATKESVQLFRIAQEAVNNAVKHADPDTVTIELLIEAPNLLLRVHDDGRGMASITARSSSGLGLLTMAHRARAIGGEFNVHTGEKKGTTIECLVRYQPNS